MFVKNPISGADENEVVDEHHIQKVGMLKRGE